MDGPWRTTAQQCWLDVAERLARQGTCLLRVYGCVVVKDGHVVSTGYCGAASGEEDCLSRGECWRRKNGVPSGTRYETCHSVHAETNALMQAGRRARNAVLYLAGLDKATGELVDARPCAPCLRNMLNAHVGLVVCRLRPPADVLVRTPRELYTARNREDLSS